MQSGELTIDGRLRRHAIKEIHRSCIQSLFDASNACHGKGVCIQPPDKMAGHLLRPPQNILLQQLSKVNLQNLIDVLPFLDKLYHFRSKKRTRVRRVPATRSTRPWPPPAPPSGLWTAPRRSWTLARPPRPCLEGRSLSSTRMTAMPIMKMTTKMKKMRRGMRGKEVYNGI